MKLKFKNQAYQTKAVESVVDCFLGQSKVDGISYQMDSGNDILTQEIVGYKNPPLEMGEIKVLENISAVQRGQNIPFSGKLARTNSSNINLDIEMETGTGKTYCYIKTIFELNKNYGWGKFIIIVPSIAIREGVYKSFEITADHFQEEYHRRIKFFIYNSRRLQDLEDFSSSSGINVMIINIQAFNARGKDNRRIYEELDEFQSRRPMDIIRANRPILILDEPQKMEGAKTTEALERFDPLFILRYSATHRTEYNKVYLLDALDAYNQKLVKKISVRGITQKGLTGTNAYLYLESIEISTKNPPVARMELEIKQKNGIKRVFRKIEKGDDLYEKSNKLDQYKGLVVSEIDARINTLEFKNGHQLQVGEAVGDVSESILRRIQIREAVKAHFEKESTLYNKGIKVLSLFFIDEVAKYRIYNGVEKEKGEYAKIFEEEYRNILEEIKKSSTLEKGYQKYLNKIPIEKTHNGYFSIDKKGRMIDSKEKGRGEKKECDDIDAYNLILKNKERLLSFEEPTRFIFSHSALREGWDNPNIFVICTLKNSDNTISRRQEVGRGMRLCVNQFGERQDDSQTVHETNILTVVANESYKDFVTGLQKDIRENLSNRPQKADKEFFRWKFISVGNENVQIDEGMATKIYRYLMKNDYTDDNDNITSKYYDDVKSESLAPLPEELRPYEEGILGLIETVYSDAKLPPVEDGHKLKDNSLNENFEKKEFQELWSRINKKAFYEVNFDTEELIEKCIDTINKRLKVSPLTIITERGIQKDEMTEKELKGNEGFRATGSSTQTHSGHIQSKVKYDLVGKVLEGLEDAELKRSTLDKIFSKLTMDASDQFQKNPEDFISKSINIIKNEKATGIIERLSYDIQKASYSTDIFTENQARVDFAKAESLKKCVYDYVVPDSNVERKFVTTLDKSDEVVVYAKLPRGFAIPTPIGNYNPDWAISFNRDKVRHIYFVAETKGSMSSMELRKVEEGKIECAKKFFNEINKKIDLDKVKYDVVDSYGKLMDIVGV
ncbi:MAG: DEAD/DEAH box helicase family protein [Bacteriovoracales bacterium]|nr:DEAD/DEAH box helicase family protein [Bacteriovoracales bacterium]